MALGRLVPAIAVASLLPLVTPAFAAAGNPTTPDRLYDGAIEFDILRNKTPVGSHRVTFDRHGDLVDVTVTSEIVVRFLAVPLYRFRYESRSRWADGRLQSIRAVTDDDGKVSVVEAAIDGDEAEIAGPAGRLRASLPLFATDHWNVDELRQSVVLNNITGKLDRVAVIAAGAHEIDTADGPRAADRYEIDGDLKFTAFYDPSGRWVGLRFKGRDGSDIDYFCRRCGPGR